MLLWSLAFINLKTKKPQEYVSKKLLPCSGGSAIDIPSTLVKSFSVPQMDSNTGLAWSLSRQAALEWDVLYWWRMDLLRTGESSPNLSSQARNSRVYSSHSSSGITPGTTEYPWVSSSFFIFSSWMCSFLQNINSFRRSCLKVTCQKCV